MQSHSTLPHFQTAVYSIDHPQKLTKQKNYYLDRPGDNLHNSEQINPPFYSHICIISTPPITLLPSALSVVRRCTTQFICLIALMSLQLWTWVRSGRTLQGQRPCWMNGRRLWRGPRRPELSRVEIYNGQLTRTISGI